jgi:ATP-dependent Clp protease ATP-binding subunit ClpC
VSNFLLVGPTGCGKTHLVRSLAYGLHGSEDKILRIDCGEYQQKHEVAKLIGAPPGYLGHEDTQALFSPDRINDLVSATSPIGIILFDEIEKAHTSIFDMLLGILDYGKLTLGSNQTVDLTNIMFFFTSNLGFQDAGKQNQYTIANTNVSTSSEKKARRLIDKFFRPEFINRLSDICFLDALTQTQALKVAEYELKRLLAYSQYTIKVTPKVYKTLIDKGWSSEYGARSISRIIDKEILTPLTDLLLTSKDISKLNSTIMIRGDLSLSVCKRAKTKGSIVDA